MFYDCLSGFRIYPCMLLCVVFVPKFDFDIDCWGGIDLLLVMSECSDRND